MCGEDSSFIKIEQKLRVLCLKWRRIRVVDRYCATGWTFRPSSAGRCKRFCLLRNAQTGFWAHSAFYSMGTGVLSVGTKRSGREVDSWFPSSAEVKNAWNCFLFSSMSSRRGQGQLYLLTLLVVPRTFMTALVTRVTIIAVGSKRYQSAVFTCCIMEENKTFNYDFWYVFVIFRNMKVGSWIYNVFIHKMCIKYYVKAVNFEIFRRDEDLSLCVLIMCNIKSGDPGDKLSISFPKVVILYVTHNQCMICNKPRT